MSFRQTTGRHVQEKVGYNTTPRRTAGAELHNEPSDHLGGLRPYVGLQGDTQDTPPSGSHDRAKAPHTFTAASISSSVASRMTPWAGGLNLLQTFATQGCPATEISQLARHVTGGHERRVIGGHEWRHTKTIRIEAVTEQCCPLQCAPSCSSPHIKEAFPATPECLNYHMRISTHGHEQMHKHTHIIYIYIYIYVYIYTYKRLQTRT